MTKIRTERMEYISTSRIIGILLVVFGHSYPFDVHIPQYLWKIYNFIYLFHMPLFIFISGYLATRSPCAPKEYIVKRAWRLLIPYFSLSLIAFVPKMLVQNYLSDSVEFSLAWLVRSELVPRENVWGHFWYIPVIFAFGVFFALCGSALRKNKKALFLTLIFSYALLYLPNTTDWFALEDIRKNLFYYVLGVALGCVKNAEEIVSSKYWLLGLPVALGLFLSPAEPIALIAVLMIGFTFFVGTRVKLSRFPLMETIERYSYTIFLLSWPAQAVMEVLLNKVLHLPVYISMLGMFAAGIAVPLICVKIVCWLEKYTSVGWIKHAIGM